MDTSQNFKLSECLEKISASYGLKESLSVGLPSYQRSYCWDPPTAISFLESVFPQSLSSSSHIGTIVFYLNQEKNSLEIIDGQQRLLTLWLLYEINQRSKNLKDEQSFFYKLGSMLRESKNFLTKTQLAKNYKSIKNHFENFCKNCDECLKVDPEVSIYFFDDFDKARKYYIRSNTLGVALTPGQLVKAYHYSIIKKNASQMVQEDNSEESEKTSKKPESEQYADPRFIVEAWRLGYTFKNKTFAELQAENKTFVELTKGLTKTDITERKKEECRFVSTFNVNISHYQSQKFSIEDFIANSDWDRAFFYFEGFFNTFQRVILGGSQIHNNLLAWPLFFNSEENLSDGLLRLQSSTNAYCTDNLNKNDKSFKRQNLLMNILYVKPGLPFFQTVSDLLSYHQKFIELLDRIDKTELPHHQPEEWCVFLENTLLKFKDDWAEYHKDNKDIQNRKSSDFLYNSLHSGTLLSFFCIFLLFELRFGIASEGKENQKNELQKLLWNVLWNGMTQGTYKTSVLSTGVYEAGPVIILSSSFSLALKRMSLILNNNPSYLKYTLEKIEGIRNNDRKKEFSTISFLL